jgi:hypothetical protein
MVPWFDPDDAGINARILLLFEAPGRRATGEAGPRPDACGSGFISLDNNDENAAATWRIFRDLNIDRSRDVLLWNIVPWYLGSDRRIRKPSDQELDEARPALVRLLGMLPELRVIVLFGDSALRGWRRAQIPFPILWAPHTSPQSLNRHPENESLIRSALRIAQREVARCSAFHLV